MAIWIASTMMILFAALMVRCAAASFGAWRADWDWQHCAISIIATLHAIYCIVMAHGFLGGR